MVNRIDKAFEEWLDELMFSDESRRQFAESRGISLDDLRWAFGSGWYRGQEQAVKELKDLQNV
jgi:hypothetical protein